MPNCLAEEDWVADDNTIGILDKCDKCGNYHLIPSLGVKIRTWQQILTLLDFPQHTSEFRDLLSKCASTAMSSKLINAQKGFFTEMVVDAVLSLDQEELNERLIGMKRVPGGAMQDSLLIKGVAFKKTFAYAGFEQQPKTFKNPKILCLNVELELKAEKDNAEVRVEEVSEYQAIVDAEWQIIFDKLEAIVATDAKVVLSKLPIGDLATQYFADRDIFCAGRVATDDLNRVVQAVGGSIQSTCSDIQQQHLGTCEKFDEKQIGSDRYNVFEGCAKARTCTLILRGGAEQFIAEVERSLHDAIMIVRRAIKNNLVVAGGGATEMEVSAYLRDHSRTIEGKQQLIIGAFARALEVIPRQLCDNAGFDATDILNKLRMKHAQGLFLRALIFFPESLSWFSFADLPKHTQVANGSAWTSTRNRLPTTSRPLSGSPRWSRRTPSPLPPRPLASSCLSTRLSRTNRAINPTQGHQCPLARWAGAVVAGGCRGARRVRWWESLYGDEGVLWFLGTGLVDGWYARV
ncbi:TCP-1/cpn60 chaperonin family-domain-containing protein [Jimgerdemannia flammicorona]|uniref:CCT-eta n=1 Tax=Jimgerdemannia flammicorona TaxID=994334 RepID=A0A433A0W8_9FUNG|nr:TCP-1/cpn60 chaperonin family-domain-containing protein [Jimgerdemannia flammicorona]